MGINIIIIVVVNYYKRWDYRVAQKSCRILNHHIAATVQDTRSSAIAEGPRDASCQLKFANCHATVQKLYLYDKS